MEEKEGEKRNLEEENRRLAEEVAALRQDKALLESKCSMQRDLLQSVGQAVITTDLAGTIKFWNKAAEEMYGWTESEALGQDVTSITPSKATKQQAAEIFANLAAGQIWAGEFEVQRRDGTTFPAYVTDRPILNEKRELIGVIGVSIDITKLKEAEKKVRELKASLEREVLVRTQQLRQEIALHTRAQQELQRYTCMVEQQSKELGTMVENLEESRLMVAAANRAKGEFMRMISHELRTPINGVLGMAELLLGSQPGEAQRSYVEAVRGSGESLLRIINEILTFTKNEATPMSVDNSVFYLRDCIEGTVELMTTKAISKRLELLCWIDPSCPALVYGDASRLRQCLLNLLSNAVKFTDKGEVLVIVESRQLDNEETQKWLRARGRRSSCNGSHGSMLRWSDAGNPVDSWRLYDLSLSVIDSGVGISEDKLGVVFELFSQVDMSNTRRHDGLGLGLASCQQQCQMMGAKVRIGHTKPGEGSTFLIMLTMPGHGNIMAPPCEPASKTTPESSIPGTVPVFPVTVLPGPSAALENTVNALENTVNAGERGSALDEDMAGAGEELGPGLVPGVAELPSLHDDIMELDPALTPSRDPGALFPSIPSPRLNDTMPLTPLPGGSVPTLSPMLEEGAASLPPSENVSAAATPLGTPEARGKDPTDPAALNREGAALNSDAAALNSQVAALKRDLRAAVNNGASAALNSGVDRGLVGRSTAASTRDRDAFGSADQLLGVPPAPLAPCNQEAWSHPEGVSMEGSLRTLPDVAPLAGMRVIVVMSNERARRVTANLVAALRMHPVLPASAAEALELLGPDMPTVPRPQEGDHLRTGLLMDRSDTSNSVDSKEHQPGSNPADIRFLLVDVDLEDMPVDLFLDAVKKKTRKGMHIVLHGLVTGRTSQLWSARLLLRHTMVSKPLFLHSLAAALLAAITPAMPATATSAYKAPPCGASAEAAPCEPPSALKCPDSNLETDDGTMPLPLQEGQGSQGPHNGSRKRSRGVAGRQGGSGSRGGHGEDETAAVSQRCGAHHSGASAVDGGHVSGDGIPCGNRCEGRADSEDRRVDHMGKRRDSCESISPGTARAEKYHQWDGGAGLNGAMDVADDSQPSRASSEPARVPEHGRAHPCCRFHDLHRVDYADLSTMVTLCPLRAMVVDDNLVNAKVASFMLHKMGYNPVVKYNGLEAVESVRCGESFDVIFMDIQMPVMDGLEATRIILSETADCHLRRCSASGSSSSHPARLHAPVVYAVTATTEPEENCIAAGMSGVIPKPINLLTVAKVMAQVYHELYAISQA
eukprot:jgi/Mesvir1/1431/Mv14427-RA.1